MSSAKKVLSRRYLLTKFFSAAEEALVKLSSSNQAGLSEQGLSGLVSKALDHFKEAYNKQLTTVICLTGAAMAPTLNAASLKEPHSFEKLVVRLIPRPSARSVFVGDVVALRSPAASPGTPEEQNVMVRRVAAVEGAEMVSDDPEDEPFHIRQGNCWVVADNSDLQPPNVIDSRSFGECPTANILGRVIYYASSRNEHGPVWNSSDANLLDRPVVESEVDVDALFPDEESSSKEKN